MPTWTGTLIPFNTPSSESVARVIASPTGPYWNHQPLPLYDRRTGDTPPPLVGLITDLTLHPDKLTASGTITTSDEPGTTYAVAVDLTDFDAAGHVGDGRSRLTFTRWRIISASITHTPTYPTATITINTTPTSRTDAPEEIGPHCGGQLP